MPYNEVEVTPQPGTGIRRKVRRFKMITHEDGEISMIQKVIFLHTDGQELIEHFRSMINQEVNGITLEQFQALERQFFPYQVEHHTRGSWVDPITGDLVAQGTEGAVPEIEWLRELTVNNHLRPMLSGAGLVAPDEDRHLVLEDAFVKMVMVRMDLKQRY